MDNKRDATHWPITITNGIAAILNIFLPISLVRILSTEDVGRYKIFFLYATVLGPGIFMTGGLANGLYHWIGNYPKTKEEIRQSWTLFLGVVLAAFFSGLCFMKPLAHISNISTIDFLPLVLSMPFFLVAGFFEDFMIARGDIWAASWYSSGFSVLRSAAILAAAWVSRSIEWAFWAYIGVSILRALVGGVLSRSADLVPSFSLDKLRPVLRFAFPVSVAALASLIVGNIDQTILSFRLNPSQFAFYSIGCLSLPPLDILETSVNRVLIPRMSRAFAHNDKERVAALFSDAVAELWRFLLPATVGLVLFSTPIIVILFTEKYASAARYLRFFAFSYLFTAFPSNSVARANGDGTWILKTNLFSAPLALGLTFLATGRWSAMGALLSVLVTSLGLRLYALLYTHKCLGMPYSRFFPGRDLITQTGVVLVAAATAILLRSCFHSVRLWFAVMGPVFTVMYFGVTYALFLRRLMKSPRRPHILELAIRRGYDREFERSIQALAEGLKQRDRFDVTVASFSSRMDIPAPAIAFGRPDIPLTIWPKRDGFSPPAVLRIIRTIFTQSVTTIHAHDVGPLVYGSFVKLITLGQVRLVVTVHSRQDIEDTQLRRLCYRIFLRFPDRIIAANDESREALERLGSPPHAVVAAAASPDASNYENILSGGSAE